MTHEQYMYLVVFNIVQNLVEIAAVFLMMRKFVRILTFVYLT